MHLQQTIHGDFTDSRACFLQTDGGFLGSDLVSFFSAVVSSAAGFYAVMLVQNAGITTLLTVRPGQSVAVTGDPSLSEPPDW